MEAFHAILLDKKNGTPLYLQLAEALGRLAETGVLPPDSKLPPIRSLASSLGINRVTVVGAYQYLRNKGVIYSKMGSGTYVSPLPMASITPPVHMPQEDNACLDFEMSRAINFANTALPHTLFPTEQFKEAFNHVLDREAGGAFAYLNPIGYEPLREVLTEYLQDYGIQTMPDAIQILSGGQQGLDIVSKAMMSYGDVVLVERPTFYGAAGAFLSRGAKVLDVPMEQDGMDMALLEDMMKMTRPRLIYVMAYFQTPTGITYSLEKKRRLLELAEEYDAYIIEDDTLYDFCYDEQHITPLKALDYKNRVVYIKSFSKILMPGLRIGFMVLPKTLRENVAFFRNSMDISASGFLQKALDYYLRTFGWETHCKMIREYGSHKYDLAIKGAKKHLINCTFQEAKGGISLWIGLPEGVSSENFCSQLLSRGLVLSLGSQYDSKNQGNSYVRLCFVGLADEDILRGFEIMGNVLKLLYMQ